MSKLHIQRWWSKRIEKSWSDIARQLYDWYGDDGLRHTDNWLIKQRICKRIYRENRRKK